MRNSVVLIDTNILLNYITNREDPYLEQSVEIVKNVQLVNVLVTLHSIRFPRSGMC